jgi:hypothetical protein
VAYDPCYHQPCDSLDPCGCVLPACEASGWVLRCRRHPWLTEAVSYCLVPG